jgi:hypothetical protein
MEGTVMAKISKNTATDHIAIDGFEGRYEDLGGYVVGFERYDADQDLAPLFKGLPDDACQCPHWGVVVRGKLVYNYTDGTQDTITTGEAYYVRPGHTPVLFADTEIVEFSPATELASTMAVVESNLASLS